MIKRETYLVPADRCGVRKVKCFNILQGFKHKTAYVGHFIKCSAKKVRGNSKFKKGKKFKAFIVRTKFLNIRGDGMSFRLKINNCVLLKKRLTPRGRDLKGPVTTLIRELSF